MRRPSMEGKPAMSPPCAVTRRSSTDRRCALSRLGEPARWPSPEGGAAGRRAAPGGRSGAQRQVVQLDVRVRRRAGPRRGRQHREGDGVRGAPPEVVAAAAEFGVAGAVGECGGEGRARAVGTDRPADPGPTDLGPTDLIPPPVPPVVGSHDRPADLPRPGPRPAKGRQLRARRPEPTPGVGRTHPSACPRRTPRATRPVPSRRGPHEARSACWAANTAVGKGRWARSSTTCPARLAPGTWHLAPGTKR